MLLVQASLDSRLRGNDGVLAAQAQGPVRHSTTGTGRSLDNPRRTRRSVSLPGGYPARRVRFREARAQARLQKRCVARVARYGFPHRAQMWSYSVVRREEAPQATEHQTCSGRSATNSTPHAGQTQT